MIIGPKAWVGGNAWVGGDAEVGGDARVDGDAWVGWGARVDGDAEVGGYALVGWYARVGGDARVGGYARVLGNGDITHTRHYLTVVPIGSEDRTVTVHRHYDGPTSAKWGHLVIAGCWQGTLDQLQARIAPGGDHEWGAADEDTARRDYNAFIAFARVRVAEWEAEPLTQADHDRWADRYADNASTGTRPKARS